MAIKIDDETMNEALTMPTDPSIAPNETSFDFSSQNPRDGV